MSKGKITGVALAAAVALMFMGNAMADDSGAVVRLSLPVRTRNRLSGT